MRINVFGASGAGSTTLAKKIADRTGFIHLDSDDYYWLQENTPYLHKRDKRKRNEMLINDLNKYPKVVVSGSVFKWDKLFLNYFDLVIFLSAPAETRIKRLRKRDKERYGELLEKDDWVKNIHQNLIQWAKQYENPSFEGDRSLRQHQEWLKEVKCRVVYFDGSNA